MKKNNETQIEEKNFFQKRLYNNNKLLKINHKTISLSSNYNFKNKIKKLQKKKN